MSMPEKTEDRASDHPVVAFRCPRALAEAAERVAASEGITRSDVARRALMRDLAREASA